MSRSARLVALALVAATVLTTNPAAGRQLTHDEILYASGNPPQLYVVDVKTGAVRQLTRGPAAHLDGHWSPDGARIAYVEITRDGRTFEVGVMNADGTSAHAVAHSGLDFNPAWAPDSARLAYLQAIPGPSPRVEPATAVHVVSADGEDDSTVLPAGQPKRDLSWNASGSRLAFTQGRRGTRWLYALDVRTGIPTQIAANARYAVWSPASEEIAFVGYVPRAGYLVPRVVVADAEGRVLATLATVRPGRGIDGIAWSPSGRSVAFASRSESAPRSHIVVAMRHRLKTKSLTSGRYADSGPGWSPDGTRVAFLRFGRKLRNGHVAIVRASGGGVRILRRARVIPTEFSSPEWRPRP